MMKRWFDLTISLLKSIGTFPLRRPVVSSMTISHLVEVLVVFFSLALITLVPNRAKMQPYTEFRSTLAAFDINSQTCEFGSIAGIIRCSLEEIAPLAPILLPERDFDEDGILDPYENFLLYKFAPRIWLHFDENRRPVNVDWLLSRSTLRYSHARCNDHQIIPFASVTRNNIAEQFHRDTKSPGFSAPWNWCEHHGSQHPSDSHTGDTKNTFFLQYADSAHNGTTDQSEWVLYGHVYPVDSIGIVVQYWQLYSFNDSFASANHEGDWEYTAVLINEQEIPQRVVFFRHGHTRDYAPPDVEWDGDHHTTYVAKGSHSQYQTFVQNFTCPDDSIIDGLQGFADKCAPGTVWDSWEPEFGGIVNVGEKDRALNNSSWIRFSGLWGEIGNAADFTDFTSGPPGPAYQTENWMWEP